MSYSNLHFDADLPAEEETQGISDAVSRFEFGDVSATHAEEEDAQSSISSQSSLEDEDASALALRQKIAEAERRYKQINDQLEAKSSKVFEHAEASLEQVQKGSRDTLKDKRLNARALSAKVTSSIPSLKPPANTKSTAALPSANTSTTLLADGEDQDQSIHMRALKALEGANEALNAQAKSSAQELTTVKKELRAKSVALQAAQAECQSLKDMVAKLQKQQAAMSSTSNLTKTQNTDLQSELQATRQELADLVKRHKELTKEAKVTEARRDRLDVELRKTREELTRAKADIKESEGGAHRAVATLTQQVQKMEKQKAELVTAFKKSLTLIDCLKKQKLHLEAVKVLQINQEEFTKSLQINTSAGSSSSVY